MSEDRAMIIFKEEFNNRVIKDVLSALKEKVLCLCMKFVKTAN